MMDAGLFITFEGTDGSGKSTQIALLQKALSDCGYAVVRTREPGGCPLAEKIRGLLLDVENDDMEDAAEAYLYAAARAQHVRQVIRPALARGAIVLCDRFLDSSLAYQGAARGLGIERVLEINQMAVGDCMPALTFLLSIPPRVALPRSAQVAAPDRLEREGLDFQERVDRGFDRVLKMYPERVRVVDATQTIEEIQGCIQAEVWNRLFTQIRDKEKGWES